MSRTWVLALALCAAGPTLAQESGLTVSVGARAWYTEWTTFIYYTEEVPPWQRELRQQGADPGFGRQQGGADADRQCALW